MYYSKNNSQNQVLCSIMSGKRILSNQSSTHLTDFEYTVTVPKHQTRNRKTIKVSKSCQSVRKSLKNKDALYVITRDASPYFAFSLKKFPVSYKARYVNDVHLPRFGGAAGVRALPLGANPDMPPYTEQPPASKVPYGDSKDFSPSNAWNDSKTAVFRQLPRPAAAVLGLTRG